MSVPRTPRAGELQSVLDSFRRALLIQDYAAQAAIANALSDVVIRMQDAGEALQAEILALGDDVQPWQIERLERFRALEAQAIQEMADFGQSVNSLLPVAQANAAAAGASAALQSVSAIAGQAVTAASFRSLSGPALRELAAATNAGPLRALLDSFGPQASAILRQTLFEGLGQGQNARVVGRAIEQTVGVGRQRAQVIARTEILRAGKSANLASFAANSNLISGWTWHAFKGPRTCSACLIMDGTEFPTTVTFFPGHPQCRCVAQPVLRDYPTPREQTGREYLESLPEAEQRALLGNRKYEAWQRGDLDLDDMVTPRTSDAWGTSYQEASLAQAEANAIARRAGGGVIPPQPTPVATTPAPAPVVQNIVHYSGLPYETADELLSPDMLRARQIMSQKRTDKISDDDALFVGKAIREESLKRAGVDADAIAAKQAKVEATQILSNEQMRLALPCYKDKDAEACRKFEEIGKELEIIRKDIVSTVNKSTVESEVIASTIKDIDPTFGSSTKKMTYGYYQSEELVEQIDSSSKLFPASVWDAMCDYTASDVGKNMKVRISKRGQYDHSTVAVDLMKYSDSGDFEGVAEHELWHFAERVVDGVLENERRFLKGRSTNESLVDIYPGLGNSEKGYRDRFIDPYMGKVYLTKKGQDFGASYEVMTSAYQYVFYRNGKLLLDDPEHAEWFFSMLIRFSS